jgi:dolichol-phosphate mannosyltransferase
MRPRASEVGDAACAGLTGDRAEPPPAASPRPSVTVVVPTYHEVENIPLLVERLARVRDEAGLELELLLMDDDSQDGSEELVRGLALDWVQLVVRRTDRGLSQAVMDGLRRSRRDFLVVMDADLSHPPEKIPEMLGELASGADMVVGSRFAAGGTTDDEWGVFRWLNSRVATLLAAPLTRIKDPMSGFFALRRSTFEGGRDFNPVGYKIGLEVLIKCRCEKVVELPIHFADRQLGKSKLSLKEQLKYLQHIRRLYIYRYGTWSHLAQFLVVGASGVAVNLALLTAFLRARVPDRVAVLLAISLSMIWNFFLNRRFSFSYARTSSILRQFVGFVAGCSVGAAVNFATTLALWDVIRVKQAAALVGVIAGTAFNFIVSRYLVFRAAHFKRASSEPGDGGERTRG